MKWKETAVIADRIYNEPYLTLKLQSRLIAQNAVPGQFVGIRTTEGFDPLLRRPISICDAYGEYLTLLILVKGKGTRQIAQKQIGDTLNMIGPLGNGFPQPSKPPLLVAGGIGIAPFLFYAKLYPNAKLLFGARNRRVTPDLTEFEKYAKVAIATEDGSLGERGTVIDMIRQVDSLQDYTINACGPDPMLRALKTHLDAYPMPLQAYFSLETTMACGFGACKGCAVETPEGSFRLACQDGPVFAYGEVQW